MAFPPSWRAPKRFTILSIVWTITSYNVHSWLTIPTIRSQMLPDLAMVRGAAIALSIVHDFKAGSETALPATRAPCKHHGNVPCCVSHLISPMAATSASALDCRLTNRVKRRAAAGRPTIAATRPGSNARGTRKRCPQNALKVTALSKRSATYRAVNCAATPRSSLANVLHRGISNTLLDAGSSMSCYSTIPSDREV